MSVHECGKMIPLTVLEWVNLSCLQKVCQALFCTVKVMLSCEFCREQAFCRE